MTSFFSLLINLQYIPTINISLLDGKNPKQNPILRVITRTENYILYIMNNNNTFYYANYQIVIYYNII